MAEKICYCFEHTDEDIKNDVLAHDESLIMAEILATKKAGGCQCASKNPKGR